jgi:hypothetical protein
VTVKNIKENGKKIKCMDKEYLIGLMEKSTKVNFQMTKGKVLENTFGR